MTSLLVSITLASLFMLFLLPHAFLPFFTLPSYQPAAYFITAVLLLLFFYGAYLRPLREIKSKEFSNQMKILELGRERDYLKQQLDILDNLVYRDSLTGLWNKSYFFMRLQEEYNRALRNKGTFAVTAIDVDRFKVINDTMGHPVGH